MSVPLLKSSFRQRISFIISIIRCIKCYFITRPSLMNRSLYKMENIFCDFRLIPDLYAQHWGYDVGVCCNRDCVDDVIVKMIINLQTRRWSFGSWLVMRLNMAFHRNACTAIPISSVTLFCPPMVTTLYPVHGTRLYVCGIWLQEKQLADSKIIPRCEEVLLILYFAKHVRWCTFGIDVPKVQPNRGGLG